MKFDEIQIKNNYFLLTIKTKQLCEVQLAFNEICCLAMPDSIINSSH